MKSLQENLKKFKLKKRDSKITNQRQEVLKMFLDRLNAERGKYPPIPPARLGVMMRFMTVSEMRYFYARCDEANNFSSYFWWSFKQNKDDKTNE